MNKFTQEIYGYNIQEVENFANQKHEIIQQLKQDIEILKREKIALSEELKASKQKNTLLEIELQKANSRRV